MDSLRSLIPKGRVLSRERLLCHSCCKVSLTRGHSLLFGTCNRGFPRAITHTCDPGTWQISDMKENSPKTSSLLPCISSTPSLQVARFQRRFRTVSYPHPCDKNSVLAPKKFYKRLRKITSRRICLTSTLTMRQLLQLHYRSHQDRLLYPLNRKHSLLRTLCLRPDSCLLKELGKDRCHLCPRVSKRKAALGCHLLVSIRVLQDGLG